MNRDIKSTLKGRLLVVSFDDDLNKNIANRLNASLDDYLVTSEHEISKCLQFGEVFSKKYLNNPFNKYLNELFNLEEFYSEQIILWLNSNKQKPSSEEMLLLEKILKQCCYGDSTYCIFYNNLQNFPNVITISEIIEKTLFTKLPLIKFEDKLSHNFGKLQF